MKNHHKEILYHAYWYVLVMGMLIALGISAHKIEAATQANKTLQDQGWMTAENLTITGDTCRDIYFSKKYW